MSIKTLRLLGAVLLASGVTAAYAGIASTKHNLTASGTAGQNKVTDASTEICAFCHTPHGGDNNSAPLWNKNVTGIGTGYQYYASSTMDAARENIGSVSVACMSCHDGTQAMDNMINQPGSGGYNAAGTDVAYTWTGSPRADAAGKLTGGAANVALIGTDLRNDHPVGIQYCGGWTAAPTATIAANDANCRDRDFKAATMTTINSANYWYVDTGTAGRQKTDLILYTRTFTNDTNKVGPSVECASCHDPHTSAQATFLRTSNTNSAVCLACHDK